MLKVFRENLKYLSWILWVIIALFVAAIFIGFGDVTSFGKGAGNAHVAATVGHETVTREDYQRSYQALDRRFQQMYGDQYTPDVAKQMQLPLQALTQAVNQKILLAEADRLGLKASDAEIRKYILTAPTFQDEKGQFVGESLYKQFLSEQLHTTPDQFENQLRDDLVLGKLVETLRAGVYISDDEVEKAYRDQVEKAKIRYVELPRGRFVQAVESIPQNELAAYYETHKAELKLPEEREAAYVLVEKAKLLPQIQMDEKAIRDYYDSHAKDFAQQEQVHARHILAKVDDQHPEALAQKKIALAQQRLAKGEDFAKVAKDLSDDTSKDSGGDLGTFGRNAMVKEFEEAAFKAEPHKVVGPIRSNFGYHLIEVLEKKPGGQQPFEQVKQQIGTRLALDRSQELAQTKAREIADRLRREKPKDPAALEALAKTDPALTFAKTGKFGQNDPVPGIGRLPAFNKAAFDMSKGAVSDPVQVGRGYAVLYLTDIQAPKTPTLAEVEPQLRLAVGDQKQQQIALDRLTQAKDEIAKGKTLEQVAGELGLQVKESQEFGGQGFIPGFGFAPQLAQAALALPTGQIGGPFPAGQGAVLFQVSDHKGGDPKDLATKKDQLKEQLANDRFQRVLSAVIEKRKRDLGVNFNRQFLEAFNIQPQQTS